MGLTSIDISKEHKKIIFSSGHSIKGVFNVGFRHLFIDQATPIDVRLKKMQETIEMAQRIIERHRIKISALEAEVQKNAMEQQKRNKKR